MAYLDPLPTDLSIPRGHFLDPIWIGKHLDKNGEVWYSAIQGVSNKISAKSKLKTHHKSKSTKITAIRKTRMMMVAEYSDLYDSLKRVGGDEPGSLIEQWFNDSSPVRKRAR